MKKAINLFRLAILGFSMLFCINSSSQTTIDSEDFESASFPFTFWNDGGGDCDLNSGSRLSGIYSSKLQDNSGDGSSMYTKDIDLTAHGSVMITFDFTTTSFGNGHDFYIEFSNDSGSSWHTTPILRYIQGTDFNNNTTYTNVTAIAVAGNPYVFNSTCRFRFRADAQSNDEDIYLDNVTLVAYPPFPEINILGNSIISIADGSTIPMLNNKTDFGLADYNSDIVLKTFIIQNTGNADLTIGAISITGTNASEFSITTYPNTTVIGGDSTTINISFNPNSAGLKTASVSIINNDSDENPYDFAIQGTGYEAFFDSDGDGILDNVDIDDDNDGIVDLTEENNCNSANGHTVNYKFLNETFGTGTGRAEINTNNYTATTTYCYEDGIVGPNTAQCPNQSSWILDDGEYCVVSKITGTVASDPENIHGDLAWYDGEDHTVGDTNGRMAVFNASYDPGVFYETTITGILSNLPITYSFWALNIMSQSKFAGKILPDITVEFVDLSGNLITSYNTGEFGRCLASTTDNTCTQGEWHHYTTSVNLGNISAFTVRFINDAPGGSGNDLAIDDIVISQTLCDLDNDGVADLYDLDSDNDGIPDVVEAGLGDHSDGTATLTGCTTWVDSSNSNGMHDLSEGHSALDSDSDGIPNYIDLDSDNDSIFDVDESGAGNSADTNYQNGDGDITGDGVGDGTDTDAVRETDVDSDGVIEYFTDGILDIYDFFEGGTINTAYGNSNQGLGSTYYALDSDSDGDPDYMDVTSDGTTYDISHTLYASLDANNDGIIDDTNDADGDGIVDLFDTDDAVFGSPRDLDRKLHLYFDGRNDYAEESFVINEWPEVSLMAWIKIDPSASGDQIIAGQDEFYLQLNADKTINVYADGNNLSCTTVLNTNQWYHIAATYSCDCLTGDFKLYLNGNEIASTTISTGPIDTDTSSFSIGRKPDTNSNYFQGYIDEVRLFNKALSTDELGKMIYQEIENNSGIARGSVIPKDITDFIDNTNIVPLNWAYLQRYYRMDTYKDDILDDLTTAGIDLNSRAKIHNTKIIDVQSAPLPFETTMSCSGDWSDANNWLHGNVWDVNSTASDYAIVKINGNIETNASHSTVGLIINSGGSLEVNGDSELFNSWYLKLDGDIDLEGESQLVQTEDSTLDPTSSGTLEKDQQGTADTFTYNYWSSPVGKPDNSSNNNSYKLPDVFTNVNFLTSGFNGKAFPVSISDYWIWKFSNQQSDNYSKWQHVRSTGTMLVGEGFTMKGPGTGSISTPQNYILKGKPNNGVITLPISAGNDYLIGNPYPSSIDAHKFINDNGPTIAGIDVGANINGTLYFWEHWGGGSHVLREYQGGYATYTLAGGVPAASKGSNDPDVGTGGTPTKTPGRYIPVAQGFFVTAETGGTIEFNNSQRVFQIEDGINSVFAKSSNTKKGKSSNVKLDEGDTRKKLRIGFNSINKIHRQLLATADENTTAGYDWGYDAPYIDTQIDDMYWLIDGKKHTIQSIDDINEQTLMPLGIHTKNDGLNSIAIDKLENVPNELNIYLHDKELNVYHNLRQGNYDVYLSAGKYSNRFEITFSQAQTLSDNGVKQETLEVLFSNEKRNIIIINPNSNIIESVEMFNILGQSLFKFEINNNKEYLEYKASQIKTGNYILKIQTEYGKMSKKILIK